MLNTNEVYFIYLGKSLPSYVNASLELAIKHSGLKVHFIGNSKLRSRISHRLIDFTAVEDFYESDEFKGAAKRVWFDHTFRNGFWLKSLERFFVLEQYARLKNLKSVFHAELDQLLFRTDRLVAKLDSFEKKGLFVPLYSSKAAVASVFYCNEIDHLSSLVAYASQGAIFPNEMELLASWMLKNPNNAFALPTLATLVNEQPKYTDDKIISLSVDEIDGVTDAAQLGQWVGGIDPILVPLNEVPKNKFIDSELNNKVLTAEQLGQVRFKFNPYDSGLVGIYSNFFQVSIYNLHIHSKIHKSLINKNSKLNNLFWLANQNYSTSFPGTRWRQVSEFIKMKIELIIKNPEKIIRVMRRYLNSFLNRRPGSYPFITGDTFRESADHIFGEFNTFNLRKIKSGDTIYCDSRKLMSLQTNVLDKINFPVVLLLINSDNNYYEDLNKSFNHKNTHKIFAQNLLEPILGIECLPVGLENKCRARNGINTRSVNKIAGNNLRKFRVMWDFTIDSKLSDTIDTANILINCANADRLNFKSLKQRRVALSNYAFIACPFEIMPDSSSMWEAIYLRCVPIVQKSYLMEIYKLLGLPIWIIDSFDELNSLSEAQLNEKYFEMKTRFETKALWMDYWLEKFNQAKRSLV